MGKQRSLSFDIGHSSIGWAILENTGDFHPTIVGTGVVTFPADDCLVSKRRDLRRTRRNIRSTRQRIERIKKWLKHRGVLRREELDKPGHAAPFLLAAAALTGVRQLTALELWHCLRWYAHNRGYDGNSRWSRQEEDGEDTEKVKNAREQLLDLGTETMAETVCRLLKLDPKQVDQKISSFLPYKTLNTAYPREIITAEVQRLLDLHCDKLAGLDELTCRLIFPNRDLTSEEHAQLKAADVPLPKRYHGGLLFGQLVPRFDNRIISRCPITWAQIYRDEIAKGTEEKEARRLAERNSKVPTKKTVEFREYRLARILANLKADGEPISAEARRDIFQTAKDQGRLGHKDLSRIVASHHGDEAETNIHAYFQLHPDSEDALVFDPVIHELQKARGSRAKLSPFWKYLPESADSVAVDRWENGDFISLQWIVDQAKGSQFEDDLQSAIEKAFKKAKKSYVDIDDFCATTRVAPAWPSGRAPFARPVLRQVTAEILEGHDATKACRATDPNDGESKGKDGFLYEYAVPESEVNQLLQKRPLDKLTNNALVRHRLLILERLIDDLCRDYGIDSRDELDITVEVAREVKELSGKTAKEIASELNGRLKDFKSAVTHLEKHAPKLPITGGLIRKCRIAMDMNWHCPFTGKKYDPYDLPKLELEHIIPFSKRKTNALHALVLTFPEVNRWKDNRTALQFIIDEGGKPVPNREKLSILAQRPFLERVAKLDTKGHPDDQKRKRARKALLEIQVFEEKEQGFTEGSLTQSSHLIKLAMRGLKIRLPHARLHSIPGIATSEIRKSWDLLGALGHPDVCGNEAMRWREKRDRFTGDLITQGFEKFTALTSPKESDQKAVKTAEKCPNDECEKPLNWPDDHAISEAHCPHCHAILKRVPKPKDDIRSLTHLHHALDAITIGLITHYFPLTLHGQNQSGKIWKALISRSRTEQEIATLRSINLFQEFLDKKSGEPRFRLTPLSNHVKEQVIHHLAKGNVVQHVPANRSGAKAELMTWRVTHIEGEGDSARIDLRQSTSTVEKGRRKRTRKTREERAGKLLGPMPKGGEGKLKDIKGALIINENFGLALDPKPTVIPFHQVTQRLADLREENDGQMPRLLRNGMLVHLAKNPPRSQQDYTGLWRISSIKNNKGKFLLDLIRPSYITAQNGVAWSGMNKTLEPLLACGLTVLPNSYTITAEQRH